MAKVIYRFFQMCRWKKGDLSITRTFPPWEADPTCRAMLLYGPDAGLVSERAAALAEVLAKGLGQDTEVVRLDDRDFAEDPGRLEIECQTQSMFASGKVVRAKAGTRLDANALKALFEEPIGNPLVVEAGNLRPDSALRKFFEKHAEAAALPCYADERGLSELIDTELGKSNLTVRRPEDNTWCYPCTTPWCQGCPISICDRQERVCSMPCGLPPWHQRSRICFTVGE